MVGWTAARSTNRINIRIHVNGLRHINANIKDVPARFRQLFARGHRSVIDRTRRIVIVPPNNCIVVTAPTAFAGVAVGKEHDILGRARPCADIAYLLKTLLPMGTTVSAQPVNDIIEVGLRRQH